MNILERRAKNPGVPKSRNIFVRYRRTYVVNNLLLNKKGYLIFWLDRQQKDFEYSKILDKEDITLINIVLFDN